ncbi:MAG: hypothetical protein WC436_06535 [Candidatus Babeliales bacterium]
MKRSRILIMVGAAVSVLLALAWFRKNRELDNVTWTGRLRARINRACGWGL